MATTSDNICIPVEWLIARASRMGDVQKAEFVRRLVGDYLMEQSNPELLKRMDEMEDTCRKSKVVAIDQSTNIRGNVEGDVVASQGVKNIAIN